MSGNTKWMLDGEAPEPATWPEPKKADEKQPKAKSVKALPDEQKKDMRGHSDLGQVRPADERFNLHKPSEESKYVRTEAPAEDVAEKPRRRRTREN